LPLQNDNHRRRADEEYLVELCSGYADLR
jgi:hypothetical protein